ncbi:MAG: hypothetical protein EBR75_05515 [Actinobacteria bacterium]|nr:hypothetical protein [Actinomycetota bacterium]
MSQLDCNFFSITPSSDLTLYFESNDGVISTSTLYITRPNKTFVGISEPLLVSVEVIFGKVEDGLSLLVYESSRLAVNELGGYTSEKIEDLDYFSFSTSLTSDEKEFSTTHAILESGYSFSLYLKFLQGYLDEDIDAIIKTFLEAEFKIYESLGTFGDALPLKILGRNATSIVGERYVLSIEN